MADRAEIEAVLADFWDKNVIEPTPAASGETSLEDMLTPLDSQTAVEVLLDLEPLVGVALPIQTVLKKGGYLSKEEFISELSAAVIKESEKAS